MADTATSEERDAVIASTTTTIRQLREQIDRLKVQADLAKLDVRDEAAKQLNNAQNACLAAEAKRRDAAHDLGVTVQALRDGLEKLIHDVKQAIDAAEAVISRG